MNDYEIGYMLGKWFLIFLFISVSMGIRLLIIKKKKRDTKFKKYDYILTKSMFYVAIFGIFIVFLLLFI